VKPIVWLSYRNSQTTWNGQKNILIHCRMGVGRAAMIAAALLVRRGQSVEEAFAQIAAARGCAVPDTSEQRAWAAKLARRE